MAAEGLYHECMDVVQNVYDRHVRAGMVYNHIECGEHYFRALAVWALLPAVQGLLFDREEGLLGFGPKQPGRTFESLFVVPGTWGRLRRVRDEQHETYEVLIKSGELRLRTLVLTGLSAEPGVVTAQLDGSELAVEGAAQSGRTGSRGIAVRMSPALVLKESQELRVTVAWSERRPEA
jgi:hypothetical protein